MHPLDATRTLVLATTIGKIDRLLREYGVVVDKAVDPLTTSGFEVISTRLSAAMQTATKGSETKALQAALNLIDVDWVNLSEAGRKRVQDAIRTTLGVPVPANVAKVHRILRVTNSKLMPEVRKGTIDKFKLKDIQPELTRRDKTISGYLNTNTSFFVRDGYNNIHDAYSEKARGIVDDGLAKGLGSSEISTQLATALPQAARKAGYWDMISTTFANRSRTYSQTFAFQEAGIEKYKFEAVMDGATSRICRFMHGQVFSVEGNAKRIQAVVKDEDPEAVKKLQPWMSEGKTEDGEPALFYGTGADRKQVAGISGDSFTNPLSTKSLDAIGLSMPPLHGRCRSTIVPS